MYKMSKKVPAVYFSITLFFQIAQICCGQGFVVYPENLIEMAEILALDRGIQPSRLLIVNVEGAVSDMKVKFNLCFLSTSTFKTRPSDHRSSHASTSPALLDALAANMEIVVIVNDYVFSRIPDLVQNIRHKCVAQVVIQTKGFERFVPTVTTLIASARGANIYCVQTFDHLVSTWSRVGIKPCFRANFQCHVKQIRTEALVSVSSIYQLSLTLKCNTSRIKIGFKAFTNFYDKFISVYEKHSNSRYHLCEDDVMICFYPITLADTDVTTLLRPFNLEVWLLILAFVLLVSKLSSWSGANDMISVCCQLILSFIGAVPVEAAFKRYSSLILACSGVAMTFLFGVTYLNCVMSYFLDPTKWVQPEDYLDCQSAEPCENTKFLKLKFFVEEGAMCKLTEQARQSIGLPLKRFLYKNETELSKAHAACFLQKDPDDIRHSVFGNTDQPLVSLPQTSETLDRLQQSGIISLRNFDKKRNRKHDSDGVNKLVRLYSKVLVNSRSMREKYFGGERKRFLTFGATRDLFDMESFQKLFPLFVLCGILSLTAALLEVANGYLMAILCARLSRRVRPG